MKKECKICLNAMVGNEERVILRMLESSYKYIDYWVIQCNGSDKTQSIIEKFYKKKNIPGFTYNHDQANVSPNMGYDTPSGFQEKEALREE